MGHRLGQHRKAAIGGDLVFWWLCPDGCPDPAKAAPSLTLRLASGASQTYAMTAVASSVKVESVETDLKTLNVDATAADLHAALSGAISEEAGLWWYDGEGAIQAPVRLLRVLASDAPGQIELADPLPHDVDVSGEHRIRARLYRATVPSADLGATTARNLLWTIAYYPYFGADLPTARQIDQGILDVVRAPFDTGLDDARLFAYAPGLSSAVPQTQQSWEPQRAIALDELVALIRERLAAADCEDDLLGEQFRRCHALLTASVILDGLSAQGYQRAELAAAFRERAVACVEQAFRRLTWYDSDGDGVPDAGETAVSAIASPTLISDVTSSDWDEDAFDRIAVDEER